MLNITVDLGSYSVKCLCYGIENKRVVFKSSNEFILDALYDESSKLSLREKQIATLKVFLDTLTEDYQVYLSGADDILTSRILELPVNNRKKAQLMLPFQLETDLPFGLSEAHYAANIAINKNDSRALVNIAKYSDFQEFFNSLESQSISASIVTSNTSVFDLYASQTKTILPKNFCILDLGHHTTKAYFFMNRLLVSTHTSYVAGEQIDQAISQAYKIPLREASVYKHQNAFVLGDISAEGITADQSKFALLMDHTLNPLFKDFERWLVGVRVRYAEPIDEIFLIGGNANIKNMKPYLSSKLGFKCSDLMAFDDVDDRRIEKDNGFQRRFASLSLFSQSTMRKSKLVNLLAGDFAVGDQRVLPLDKYAFIGLRVAIIALVALVALTVERVTLNSQLSSVNKKMAMVLKSPLLEINKNKVRQAKKRPDRTLQNFEKKVAQLKKEVVLVQSSIDNNALLPLKRITQVMRGVSPPFLKSYQAVSQGDFTAIFDTTKEGLLIKVEKAFNTAGIKDFFTESLKGSQAFKVDGSDL